MDAFTSQLSQRLPLAMAFLETFDFAFDQDVMNALYDQHRGRCYNDVLTFDTMLKLMRDALVEHGGSAHKLFVELERDDLEPANESNFYRKLQRMPVDVSRALLRETTARIMPLMQRDAMAMPACVDAFEVVILDGKKIKNAAKKLAPTRGYSGKLIGAKALVAVDARRGLALAMSDSLDGEANDVPLVPALLPQVRETVAAPIVWLADRQFGDAATLSLLQEREGDHFVVRVRQGLVFKAESTRVHHDEQGRRVTDETGILQSGGPMKVRRITLHRAEDHVDEAGAEKVDDVILLTDLMDEAMYPALQLLSLYRKRWGIEQVFQEVTEIFSLRHLIGSSPRAVLFQFAWCLLIYNLVQVIKMFVALDGMVKLAIVSTFRVFYDVQREMMVWSYLSLGPWQRGCRSAQQMRARLHELTKDSWCAVVHTKASDKPDRKKRSPPGADKQIPGGHTSVQRLLDRSKNKV